MMIPWRDYSFLKDEDDIALLDDLRAANEEPVTGKKFYEHYFKEAFTESNIAADMEYFNNFEHDGSTKNHILLFGLDIGLFLTVTGLLMIYKQPNVFLFSLSLAIFGIINIFLQVTLELFQMSGNGLTHFVNIVNCFGTTISCFSWVILLVSYISQWLLLAQASTK